MTNSEALRLAVDDFRRAVEELNVSAAVALMSDDVRLYSPVFRAPFEGREAVTLAFDFLATVTKRHQFVSVLYGDSEAILCFEGEIAGRQCEWIHRIQLDKDNWIHRVTDMVRPLSAVLALKEAVAQS